MTNRLRVARVERGWSQDRLVRAILEYAREHLLDVASQASLKVYVSEWENGRRSVSETYSAILRSLLGKTNDELFGEPVPAAAPAADGYDELLGRIDSARSLSLSMVDTFLAQTELLRSFDRQMGAAGLVDQMRAHLSSLEDALTFAVLPDARRPVATALAGAATLAAWQALDVGAVERAWRHYELAKRAASEAESPMYLAHAMAEQAYVLSDAGRAELAVDLVRDAQRTGGSKVSPRLAAWLFAAEAELCAKAGLADDCRQALDRAEAVLPPGEEARDPDMLSLFLNTSHLTRWRGNALAILGEDDAVAELYAALDRMDPAFTRAMSGLRCDLAQAHMVRGEIDQARQHLQQARLLANRTGSVRQRRRIERLTDGL
ncbi:helix-turn-helix domain-containing protein [Kitasatospora azatica]|uniref:helix-turn-helix domain-containing protein n=1 Tax=Kitasatospora azatica TaxID=58347 RepID=UPI000563447B|nr:helix-turn-helix transcriptional regulator [Kitasatospora azatica]